MSKFHRTQLDEEAAETRFQRLEKASAAEEKKSE